MTAIRRALALALIVPAFACNSRVEAARQSRARTPGAGPAAGDWRGTITFRDAPLALSLHLAVDGKPDSSSFSAPGLVLLDAPLADVRSGGGDLHFTASDGDGPIVFDGTLRGDTLAGTAALPARSAAREGAPTMTFRLTRAPAPLPRPYSSRAVAIKRGDVSLAATLLFPRGASRTTRAPGLLIMGGSSTNLRSDYRFFADTFARAGVAVLLWDKRGNGASSGDYRRASYDDLVADATAAFDALVRQPEVDPAHAGLWGLSQGAFLAPRVALGRAAFVVGVSPPGMPIAVSAAYQDSVRVAWARRPADDARAAANLNRALGNALYAWAPRAELEAILARDSAAPWRALTALPTAPPDDRELDGWYWRGRVVDPTPWWQALQTVPVLLVYGENDELVPADTSARLIRRALARGLNRDVAVRIYAGANHVIRLTASPLDDRTVAWHWPTPAPGAIDGMVDWMRKRAARAR